MNSNLHQTNKKHKANGKLPFSTYLQWPESRDRSKKYEDVKADIRPSHCVSLAVDIDRACSRMLAIPPFPKETNWTAEERLGQPASESMAATDANKDVALEMEGSLREYSHIEHED